MEFCPHLLPGQDLSSTAVGGSSDFCFQTVCGFWCHVVSRRAAALILVSVSLKSKPDEREYPSFYLLDSFVMLLSASPTSKIHFLCETCLFC